MIESRICQAKIQHAYVCRIFSKRRHIADWLDKKDKKSEGAMYYSRNMQEWNGCQVFEFVYRESCSPFRSVTGSQRKKALACGWQIGVSLRRHLEGCGMSRRVDGFPAGKHDERICTRFEGTSTRRQQEKRNRRRLDEKGASFTHLFLPLRGKKKTYPPAARLISLILASGGLKK